MGQWFQRQAKFPLRMSLPHGLTILVAVWLAAHRREIQLSRPEGILLALVALAAAGALVVWLWKAPDPRFAYHLFYVLLIVAVAAAMRTSRREMTGADVSRRLGWLFVVFWVCASLPLRPPASNVGYSKIPVVKMNLTFVHDGTRVFFPAGHQQAWAAELPSAPSARKIPFLRLRQEGDLSSGFEQIEPPVTRDTGGEVRP